MGDEAEGTEALDALSYTFTMLRELRALTREAGGPRLDAALAAAQEAAAERLKHLAQSRTRRDAAGETA